MKILFVCSSNICRSPYCEYMLKDMASKNPTLKEEFPWIRSAAVFNKSKKMNPKTKLALLNEGIDEAYIDSHKPAFKWTDKHLFEEADVIIGMTKSNKIFLPLKYHKKFTTLSEFVDGEYKAVPDPFLMRNLDDYMRVMAVIKDYLIRLEAKIVSKNKQAQS